MRHDSLLRLWQYINHLQLVFCCWGRTDLEFAESLRDPALSPNMFRRQLKTYFFCEICMRFIQCIRDLLIMCYVNLHFTYLLTYLLI